MILSVSRRTDVPAFYTDWFLQGLKAGEVFVPSPFVVEGKTAKVKLEPLKVTTNLFGMNEVAGNIEGIVFWTKNPKPMLDRIDEVKALGVPFYFQYTLNPYSEEFEKSLPPLVDRINTFIELAKHCQVIWRYDPLFTNNEITADWHLMQFESLAQKLSGSTSVCFINILKGKFKNMIIPTNSDTIKIAKGFLEIGKRCGIQVKACADLIDLESVGVSKGKCIDPEIFEALLSAKVKKIKLKGATRIGCGCMDSVDIGTYNTCFNGCIYCYANKGKLIKLDEIEHLDCYDRKTSLSFDY